MKVLAIINRKAKMFSSTVINNCLNYLKASNAKIDVEIPDGKEVFLNLIRNSRNYDFIIIGGGDGTISLASQVLRIVKIPFTVIPLGRGNSFYKAVYGDVDPLFLFKKLSKGFIIESIDLGLIENEDKSFVLGASLGIIPDIIQASEKFNFLGGRLAYSLGALMKLILGSPKIFSARILINQERLYYDKYVLISIGLTQYRAGRFKLFPKAKLNDGFLDLLIVPPVKRLKAIKILRLSVKGEHITLPSIIYDQVSNIEIEVDGIVPFEVDGDILEPRSKLKITLMLSSLNVLKPFLLLSQ